MQDDLRISHPSLDIEIVGINEADPATGCPGTTYSAANPTVTALGDIPWLQDVDEDGDGESDNWLTSWPFTYRDVVIVDANSVAVDTFNLTVKSLEEPDSYATLRQMLIDVAESTVAPQDDSTSIAIDGSFEIDVFANDGGESRLQV